MDALSIAVWSAVTCRLGRHSVRNATFTILFSNHPNSVRPMTALIDLEV